MWLISDDDGRILLYDRVFSTAEKAISCIVGTMASAYNNFTYERMYDDDIHTFTIRLDFGNFVKRFYVREIPVDVT